jgi:hypothetical protein
MRILRLVSLVMIAASAIIGGIISYHACKGVDLGFLVIVTSPNAALSLFLFATGSLNSLMTWIIGWGLLAPALFNLWLLYGLMLYVLSAPENLSTGLADLRSFMPSRLCLSSYLFLAQEQVASSGS